MSINIVVGDCHDRHDHIKVRRKPKKHPNAQNLSRYDLATFLPKFATQEMSKASNVYFFGIAMLQQIPDFSPTGRWGTLITLAILLLLSLFREIIEDLRRRKSDIDINHRKTCVFRSSKFESVCWQTLNVGDIIEVEANEQVPADAVILATSEPLGICYLETSLLDGESNLKLRQAPLATRAYSSDKDLQELNIRFNIDPIDRQLNQFSGNMTVQSESQVYLDVANFAPRGSRVVNTSWIICVVVAVGHDTKQLLNAMTKWHRKNSLLDKRINKILLLLLMFLLASCLMLSVFSVAFSKTLFDAYPYYIPQPDIDIMIAFISHFVRFLVMFHNVIPVSLMATIQIVRIVQASFIKRDKSFYSDLHKKSAHVQNSQLNEMLGMVDYVFADKTGTITKNKLTFKKCEIQGEVFSPEDNADRLRHILSQCRCNKGTLSTCPINCVKIKDMFLAMSVCHTVIPHIQDGVVTLAGSPDEKAVLKGAEMFGIIWFLNRLEQGIQVEHLDGSLKSYKLLHIFEYTNERKRMSVVLKSEEGDFFMVTKGADSAIFPLLKSKVPDQSFSCLESFAKAGLRTMCYAMKNIHESYYDLWFDEWNKAQMRGEQSHVREKIDSIEKNLEFLGITAVEDELQDHVDEAMDLLHEAKIKVWMLSGDRQENVVSIAKSSHLIHPKTSMILLPDCDIGESRQICLDHVQKLRECRLDQSEIDMALIVSGKTVAQSLDCPRIRESLIQLSRCCTAVICFRVDPGQKAELIKLAKSGCARKSIILAIGDGSNDVPMLETADIGVGISGIPEEHIQIHGSEVACVVDYSIAEFSGLPRLIQTHGVWNSIRMERMICFFFYKNVLFYFVQLLYVPFTRFSSRVLFDTMSITLYNVVFTSLSPFIICLLDYNRPRGNCAKERRGETHIYFWLVQAIIHGVIIFSASLISYGYDLSTDWSLFSTAMYASVLITVCLKPALESTFLSKCSKLLMFFSIPLFILFNAILNFLHFPSIFNAELLGSLSKSLTTPLIWAQVTLLPFICILFDLFFFLLMSSCAKASTQVETEKVVIQKKQKWDEAVKTMPRNESRMQLENMAHGFAFTETASVHTAETDCMRAYSKSLRKPSRLRHPARDRRTKSNV